jgi:hypothetical protein
MGFNSSKAHHLWRAALSAPHAGKKRVCRGVGRLRADIRTPTLQHSLALQSNKEPRRRRPLNMGEVWKSNSEWDTVR